MSEHYIGIMTGNSMDAVDAVLIDFSTTTTLLETAQHPLPADLTRQLRQLASAASENSNIPVSTLFEAQNALTDLCASAVAKLNAAPSSVRAIGCHGQTIAHRPGDGATWQLLNGARLAEQTQIDVICDFRARDIASGGEGAPLAPFFHQHYFAAHAPCDIINIGGIANITHIDADGNITAAYDTGPGMMLMDAWYRNHHNSSNSNATYTAYDTDGAYAASGSSNDALLQQLLAHPYLKRPAPKSCGREEFSLAQLPADISTLPAANVQATLLDFTAHSIAAAVRAPTIFLCGGGSKNRALTNRLQTLLPAPPKNSGDIGISAQWIEAAAFAYLAKCHIERHPLPATAVTGGGARIAGAHYPR